MTITMIIIIYHALSFLTTIMFSSSDGNDLIPGGWSSITSFSNNSDNFQISNDTKIRFTDVVGLKNVKKDLLQYVNYIKNRDEYVKAGFKVPSGLIFSGPPGTGKTMLSKAIAGETSSTFIYACGSDFIEVYVGVGAQRIRNLFKNARRHKPCIIFID